tara:strand:- start:2740 stop:2973 length:234 start_codon:yes stop_codon:yes gene_type:complete
MNNSKKVGGIFDTYREYLASPIWKQKRDRLLELKPLCVCGRKATEVHHLTYKRVCNEKVRDLLPLCRRCHQYKHNIK